jgi:sirohydrochlorin ferrochelatase
MSTPAPITAIIIVDHGSRRGESNAMLEQFVDRFRATSKYEIVEPAHMELAEPSIDQAFDRCVERGAQRVVVMPYFLLPGRHWSKDIPHLTAQAAAKHPGVAFMVTAPFGLHPLMMQIVEARVEHCLKHVAGEAGPCDVCQGTKDGCEVRGGG